MLGPGVDEIAIRLRAGNYKHAFTGQRCTSQGTRSPIVVIYWECSQIDENFRRALVNRGVID